MWIPSYIIFNYHASLSIMVIVFWYYGVFHNYFKLLLISGNWDIPFYPPFRDYLTYDWYMTRLSIQWKIGSCFYFSFYREKSTYPIRSDTCKYIISSTCIELCHATHASNYEYRVSNWNTIREKNVNFFSS